MSERLTDAERAELRRTAHAPQHDIGCMGCNVARLLDENDALRGEIKAEREHIAALIFDLRTNIIAREKAEAEAERWNAEVQQDAIDIAGLRARIETGSGVILAERAAREKAERERDEASAFLVAARAAHESTGTASACAIDRDALRRDLAETETALDAARAEWRTMADDLAEARAIITEMPQPEHDARCERLMSAPDPQPCRCGAEELRGRIAKALGGGT